MTINKINKARRKINLVIYHNTEIQCFNYSVIRKEQTRGLRNAIFLHRYISFIFPQKVTKIPKYSYIQIKLYRSICIFISGHHKFSKNWNLLSIETSYLERAYNYLH